MKNILKYMAFGSILLSLAGCVSRPEIFRDLPEADGYDVAVSYSENAAEVRIGNRGKKGFDEAIYVTDYFRDKKADSIECPQGSDLCTLASEEKINEILEAVVR